MSGIHFIVEPRSGGFLITRRKGIWKGNDEYRLARTTPRKNDQASSPLNVQRVKAGLIWKHYSRTGENEKEEK